MKNVSNYSKKNRLVNILLTAVAVLAVDAHAATANICSLDDIKNWVEKNRIFAVVAPHYPPIARGLGQKGRTVVSITLDSETRLESAVLRYSSGHKELDEGIIEMVLKSSGLKLGAPMCAPKGERFAFDLPLNFQFNDGNFVPSRGLLLDYFRVTQLLEIELSQTPKLTHLIFTALKQSHPNASTDALEIIDQEVKHAIKRELSLGGHYLEKMIEIHQAYYTEEDIRSLISFYQSHLGRKVVKTGQLIQAEMQRFAEVWRPGFTLSLSDRINSRFKEGRLSYELPRLKPEQSERDTGQQKDFIYKLTPI